MKRRDIIRKLEAAGWTLKRYGASHDIYQHPHSKQTIPIPRHREINELTGIAILKEAGL